MTFMRIHYFNQDKSWSRISLIWVTTGWLYDCSIYWNHLTDLDCEHVGNRIYTMMSDGRSPAPSFDQDMYSPSSVAIYTPAKIDHRSEIRGLGRKIPSLGPAKRSIIKVVKNEGHGSEFSSPDVRPAPKSLHVGRSKVEGHYMKTTEASR